MYDPEFVGKMKSFFKCLGHDKIAKEVKQAWFFVVVADEARSQKTEQLSISLHYATPDLEIKERFIQFVDCSNSRNA